MFCQRGQEFFLLALCVCGGGGRFLLAVCVWGGAGLVPLLP